VIYRGYVDSPRNTDNAWMETALSHFHCGAELSKLLLLSAAYDARGVRWTDIDLTIETLYPLIKDTSQICLQAKVRDYLTRNHHVGPLQTLQVPCSVLVFAGTVSQKAVQGGLVTTTALMRSSGTQSTEVW
jgi:hypothetical protein